MIERIRALIAVAEEGSVNRAALRLRITQPALSRQMKALEDEVGGRLLERGTGGVTLTGLGHAFTKAMRPVVDSYDAGLAALRRQARGERRELRIGYLGSSAQAILSPALTVLRRHHPSLKLKLHDFSPREQIDALRAGQIDVALIGQEGAVAAREFHSAKIRALGVCAALSDQDPLARRRSVLIADLRGHDFIGLDEREVPGRNRWMTALGRTAGFRPRFVAMVDGIANVLSHVVAESAVTLLPDYSPRSRHPGVAFVPVSDPAARWDFIVLWQKGRTPEVTQMLVDALRINGAQGERAAGHA